VKRTVALACLAVLLPLAVAGAFELDDAKPARTFDRPVAEGEVVSVCWSADGDFLGASGEKATVYAWDVHTGDVKERLVHGPPMGGAYVSCIAAYPMAPIMAHCSEFGIKFNITGRRGRIPTLKLDLKATCWCLDFSSNGNHLATADKTGELVVWDLWTNQPHRRFEPVKKLIMAISYNPDGNRIAAACQDGKCRVYDVRENKLVHTLEGDAESCTAVAWSADGKWLAAAGRDKKIRVYSEDGKAAGVLEGHEDRIYALSFLASKGSPVLASGGKDKTVRLWDVTTQKETQKLALDAVVSALAWKPGGGALAVGAGQHVRIYEPKGEKSEAPAAPAPGGEPRKSSSLEVVARAPDPGSSWADVYLVTSAKTSLNGRLQVGADGELVLSLARDGKPLELTSDEKRSLSKNDVWDLRPNDILGRRCDLARYFGKLEAGAYTLSATYQSSKPIAGATVWTGAADSPAVTFKGEAATAAPDKKPPFHVVVRPPAKGTTLVDVYLAMERKDVINSRFSVADASETKAELALSLRKDGKPLELRPDEKISFATGNDFIVTRAGDLVGRRLDLARYFGKLEPGTYALVATYHNSVPVPGQSAWIGKMESEELGFTLEP
jgi:WD40 repeat protein